MFTSRAEHRLLLRIDNADLRLTNRGRQVGLVDDERWARFSDRRERYERNLAVIDRASVENTNGTRIPARELLRQPQVRLQSLIEKGLPLDVDSELDAASVETAVKYAGYLKQELARAERLKREERRVIPASFPFSKVPGLSREVVQRLSQVRPTTLGQASRVPGVTPAAVAVLAVFLTRLSSDTHTQAAN